MASLPEKTLKVLAEQDIATQIIRGICKVVEVNELCACPQDCENCLLAVDGDNIIIDDQTPKDRAIRLRKVISLLYFNPEIDINELLATRHLKEQSNSDEEG